MLHAYSAAVSAHNGQTGVCVEAHKTERDTYQSNSVSLPRLELNKLWSDESFLAGFVLYFDQIMTS